MLADRFENTNLPPHPRPLSLSSYIRNGFNRLPRTNTFYLRSFYAVTELVKRIREIRARGLLSV